MPDSADTPRQARAQQLTQTLRSLQRRLNQTVDELCALAAGSVEEVASLQAEASHWEPALLTLPLADPVRPQPKSGQPLGPGASFYVGEHHGVLQLVQCPRHRAHLARYACTINYADFDGGWMSLVFDLRSLLASVQAGRVRLVLLGERSCVPVQALQVKCSWRSEGAEPQSRQALVGATEALQLSIDLGWLQPSLLRALDLHLIFSVAGRGTISLHDLQVTLVSQTDAADEQQSDIFEEAP